MTEIGNRMWRIRDIREVLTERLGFKVTPDVYRYWQHLGIVPKAKPGARQWDACFTQEEAMAIIDRAIACQIDTDITLQFKYRRPGVWRGLELRAYIAEQLGIHIDLQRWDYLQKIGIIPEPEIRLRKANGAWSQRYGWSDAQAQTILAIVAAHMRKKSVDPPEMLSE